MRPGRWRIEVVTKAGASAYHGTSNFVFRDNRINAREPFAATRPQEQRRIVESSLTGPIGSGKTSSFLFAGTFQSEARSEEHTSELQSLTNLVCRLLLEKKKE